MYLLGGVGYVYCFVLFYTVFTIYCGIYKYNDVPITRDPLNAPVAAKKLARHSPCSLCYAETSQQDGRINFCPECNVKWCHMCNHELPSQDRWFFNSVPNFCGCRFMGPLVCDFYHFCRFKTGPDGRRELRSDDSFTCIAWTLGLLWCFWAPLYWLVKPLEWATRATFDIFSKSHWLLIPFALIVWPVLLSVMLICSAVYTAIWVFCVQIWCVPCLSCHFKLVPLSRDPALLNTEDQYLARRGMIEHVPCPECYSDDMKFKSGKNECLSCNSKWCHMCNLRISKEKHCFGVFESTCFGRGLGPGVCGIFYFCRFTTNSDGKRKLRSKCGYYSLAIPAAVFFPIWYTVFIILCSLWWPV